MVWEDLHRLQLKPPSLGWLGGPPGLALVNDAKARGAVLVEPEGQASRLHHLLHAWRAAQLLSQGPEQDSVADQGSERCMERSPHLLAHAVAAV